MEDTFNQSWMVASSPTFIMCQDQPQQVRTTARKKPTMARRRKLIDVKSGDRV
jgi:hypothetical protein